jgi:hypothetical protein
VGLVTPVRPTADRTVAYPLSLNRERPRAPSAPEEKR